MSLLPLFSPSICHEVVGPSTMILVFFLFCFVFDVEFEASEERIFSLSSFTLIKRLYSSSSLSAIKMVSSAYLGLLISDVQSSNIYSHYLGSILTMASLDAQKFLILMKSNLVFFFFPLFFELSNSFIRSSTIKMIWHV